MERLDQRTDEDLLQDYAEHRGDPTATEAEIVRRGLRIPDRAPNIVPRFRSRLLDARRGHRRR